MVRSRRPVSRSRTPAPKARPKKPAPRKASPPTKKSSPKSAARPPAKPAAKPAAKSTRSAPPAAPVPAVPAAELAVPLPGGRRHVLSLSFVRDGDEFLARLESDSGHITELKNRSLDQLLTLVASELEDLLE